MTRAGDDVAFGLENAGTPPELIWPAVDEALAAVGFPYGRDRATAALSGGQKQRLVLAGALAGRPGLLLLDEPTAQLDPAGARLVRGAVARAVADRGRPPCSSSTTTPRPGCRSSTAWSSCAPTAAPCEHGAGWAPAPLRMPVRTPRTGRRTPAAGRGGRLHPPRQHRPRPAAHRRRPPRRAHAGRHRTERRGEVDAGPAPGGAAGPDDGPGHRRALAHRGPAPPRPAAAPLAGRRPGHPHRHGVPAPRAPVPHRPGARRAGAGPAAVRRRATTPPTGGPRS